MLQNLESGSGLYNKNTPENKKALIDDLRPILLETYLQIKTMVYQQKLYQNAYKNIVPFSVLSAIQQEMETIKADENIVPISEFNYIISDAIKNQPAPFIYERIGEKYRHFLLTNFKILPRCSGIIYSL